MSGYVMDAARRVVFTLLFMLWSVVGAPTTGETTERAEEVAPATCVRTTTSRREPTVRRARRFGHKFASGPGDDNPIVLGGSHLVVPDADLPTANSRAPVAELTFDSRGPLAGCPRGPPVA